MEDSADSGGGGTLSSPDFEFSIALSPSSKLAAAQLCPADELFYKGQLLPLHLSPRLSLVSAILLSSSASSSEATSTTASRDSNGSSSSADSLGLPESESESPRPSSATEEDCSATKRRRYFSSFTTRFSAFLPNRGNKKDATFETEHKANPSSKKPAACSSSAKEMIMKYVDKVKKPLFEKIASFQHKPGQQQKKKPFSLRRTGGRTELFSSSHSFDGNLRSPWRMRSAASCPSSMRSSPSHSGLLCSDLLSVPASSSSSSKEELQSAIQAAIAHCKSTMVKQKKTMAPVNSLKDDIFVF